MAGGERHVSKGPRREGNTFSVVWKRVERNEVLEMGRNWDGRGGGGGRRRRHMVKDLACLAKK